MTGHDSSLADERDFLLRSIQQLDADHEAGLISEREYVDLRDEQTVRAASIIETLETSNVAPPPVSIEARRPRPRMATVDLKGKRSVWVIGVTAFVLVALVGVIGTATGRFAGDNTTGSIKADSNTLLERAQDQSSKGNIADAVKTYDQVLKQDSRNVQALTYRGWLIRLAGLPQEGLDSINQALAVNPKFPDAHFFKGFILFRDRQDPNAAITEFNEFLADNPPKEMVPLVQQTLADAQAEAAAAAKK